MTELKLIDKDALKKQQENAPEIASYLLPAAELAERAVKEMLKSLEEHITRKNDPRARSGGAHDYWVAYFEYHKSPSEIIPIGLGYDPKQWNEQWKGSEKELGLADIPWRVLIFHTPLLDAIRTAFEAKGYSIDGFSASTKFHDLRDGEFLWIPVPKELIRGCSTAPLLAGAVNAFLGSIIE